MVARPGGSSRWWGFTNGGVYTSIKQRDVGFLKRTFPTCLQSKRKRTQAQTGPGDRGRGQKPASPTHDHNTGAPLLIIQTGGTGGLERRERDGGRRHAHMAAPLIRKVPRNFLDTWMGPLRVCSPALNSPKQLHRAFGSLGKTLSGRRADGGGCVLCSQSH